MTRVIQKCLRPPHRQESSLEDVSNETSDKSSTPWDGSVCVCVGEGGRFLTSAN